MTDKKELIRSAAAKVFAVEGFYHTSVKMIAEEAGIAVGTIYLYFKTKEDILDNIFLVEHDKRIEYLKTLESENLTFEDIIRSFLDFHFNQLSEESAISRVLLQEALSPLRSTSEGMQKFSNLLPNQLQNMLESAQKKGEIREMDSFVVSRLIFQLIKNSVYIIQIDESEQHINRVKEEVLTFIANGIIA